MFFNDKFVEQFLDSLFEAVYFVDTKRAIMHWNKAAEALTGWKKNEIIGRRCVDNILVHVDGDGNNLCNSGCPLVKAIETKMPSEVDIYLHHKDGHRVPVKVRVIPVVDDSGEVTGAIEIFTNAQGDLFEQIEELRKLSMLDSLTGVANRRFGEKTIRDKIEELERFKWQTGIVFIDIDNFKNINDSYSHAIGDRMIKMVAGTLRESVRSFDHVVRWGGEEFVVILSNISHSQLKEKAELLRKLVAESFFFEKEFKLSVTISSGATMIKEGDNLDSVIERADKLMYKSKKMGKNKVTVG
ncbi:MAG: diguanylate cyclase [bacterium]